MDDGDPLKTDAHDSLQQLMRKYSQLDDALLEASEWDSTAEVRDRIAPLLANTIEQQRSLMAAVRRCIDADTA